jgi:uncharacterized protein YjiS (DUF1127 family)
MRESHGWIGADGLPHCDANIYIALHQIHSGAAGAHSEKTMTLKTLTHRFNVWRRYRASVRELSQLTDRELNDLGIRRGEIEAICRKAVGA